MGLLLFYAFISILFSFLCSILEAVLLSVTPTFVNLKKQEGKPYARALEELKKDVDKPLIAILTLNTVAHTFGAILVGVQAKYAYADMFGSQPEFLGMPFSEEAMVGVVSTIMTLLILIASEIIPKTIGATYWKQLVNFSTRTLRIMVLILKYTGILWILQLFTKLIGKKGSHGSVLSREDFTAMAEIAEEEGVVEESESKVIRNLLTFDEIQAKDIMTPRTVIKMAPESMLIREFFEANRQLRFSRIPLYGENHDHITGYVLKDQVLESLIDEKGDQPLVTLRREIQVTERSKPLPELFNTFVTNREHMALVVDEYGSVSGLVTMEDVIETLLGLEIMDESDNVEDLQLLARKNWEARAKRLGLLNDKPDSEEPES